MENVIDRGSLESNRDELEYFLDLIADHTVPEFVSMFGSFVGSVVLLVLMTFYYYSDVSGLSEFMGAMYIIASLAHLFIIPTVLTALSMRFIEFRDRSAVVSMIFLMILSTQLDLGEEGIVSNVMFLTFCALFSVSFSVLTSKVFKFDDDTVGRILCTILTLFAVYGVNKNYCGGGMTFSAVWIVFILLVCFPFELGYFYLRTERADDGSHESRPEGGA